MSFSRLGALLPVLVHLMSFVHAFDNNCNDNLVIYWGQNSYGAVNSADTANWQKPINFYCQDDTINVIPIAFVDVFNGPGGLPEINLANTCSSDSDPVFNGTELANCQFLASDIEQCQTAGKIITISLGGAGGSVGFLGDADGAAFADTIWDLFLGGSSDTRPFGNAVLDGVDLDIESGVGTGYAAFVNQLRTHFTGASKQYYVTAAPQCPYPDAALGSVINAAMFDAVYVQFYNNPCGLQNFDSASQWDYGIWDYWARYVSPNPDVKIYIGAPASSSAAGGGYQPPASLEAIVQNVQHSFPSFGGVMMWDASQAYANNRYDQQAKSFLTAAGTCDAAFVYPSCSAPAYVSGQSYTSGQQVSFGGYVWEAKYYASAVPASDPNGDWSAISACSDLGGAGPVSQPPSPTVMSSTATSSMPAASSTSVTSASAPTTMAMAPSSSSTMAASSVIGSSGGSCVGMAAWNSQTAYQGGAMVAYGGHSWTAKWWTEADTPGGTAGVWTDNAVCGSVTGLSETATSSSPMTSSPSLMSSTTTSTADTMSSKSTISSSMSSPASSITSPTISIGTMSSASQPTATAGAGNCAGVAAWDSQVAYTGGHQVTYNGHLWTAKWWSEADTPGGTAGVWTDNGACTSVAGRMLF